MAIPVNRPTSSGDLHGLSDQHDEKPTRMEPLDKTAELLEGAGDVPQLSPEREKKLLRKIDWMVMPLLWGCYFFQFVDKSLINYAAVMGLYEDANITVSQFSTLALIFFVAFLVMEFPHAYCLQRFPAGKYLGCVVVAWGISVAATAACSDFVGLVVTRVLLGMFEAAVAPALMLVTTMWYRRVEQPSRTGIWYLGVGCGIIFGSLVSFGFQHYHGDDFTSWQIMFLLIGFLTIALGIAVIFLLPDSPMTSRLSREEKIWAIERLRDNMTGIENKHFKYKQVMECFGDPQMYLFFFITLGLTLPNSANSSFAAQIIQGFGFNSKQTALLSMPAGVVSSISVYSATWAASKTDQRAYNMVIQLVIGIVGGCLQVFMPAESQAGRLAGNYLTNCIAGPLPVLYSWVGSNVAGHTKKVTMNAIVLIAFSVGNIIGPLSFRGPDRPEYVPAKILVIAACVWAIFTTMLLRFYYMWQNKQRDRMHHVEQGEDNDRQGEQEVPLQVLADRQGWLKLMPLAIRGKCSIR